MSKNERGRETKSDERKSDAKRERDRHVREEREK